MGRPKTKPDAYSIPTVCACGCGQTFYNPDDHYRYRKFIEGHYDNKGEKHPRFGKVEEREHLERRVESIKKTLKSKPPTGLELALSKYLDSLDIKYIPQTRMGTAIVDAYIPDLKLCIFADGEYWHNKPGAKERDKKQVEDLKEHGYNVIRLKSVNYGYDLDFGPLKKYLGIR